MEHRIAILVVITYITFLEGYGKTYLRKYYHVSTMVTQVSHRKRSLLFGQYGRHVPDSCLVMSIKKMGPTYNFCLLIQDSGNLTLTVIKPEGSREVRFDNSPESAMVRGFVLGEQYNSSALGYVRKAQFFGEFYSHGKKFWVEDARVLNGIVRQSGGAPYPLRPDEQAIVYDATEIFSTPEKVNEKKSGFSKEKILSRQNRRAEVFGPFGRKPRQEDIYHRFNPYRIFVQFRPYTVVCKMALIADHMFYSDVAYIDDKMTFLKMTHIAMNLKNIFTPIDFNENDDSENIHFNVRDLFLFTEEESKGYPIKGKYKSSGTYLDDMSKGLNLKEFCLGLVLTAFPFQGDRGASYKPDVYYKTGGICEENVRIGGILRSRNLAIISTVDGKGRLLSSGQVISSLAHYMARAMGASELKHKDPECEMDENGLGPYLMTSSELDGSKLNNWRLTKCCKRNITNVFHNRANCFILSTDSFCGNGIVEPGEECDAGTVHLPLDSYFFKGAINCCGFAGQYDECKMRPKSITGEDCPAKSKLADATPASSIGEEETIRLPDDPYEVDKSMQLTFHPLQAFSYTFAILVISSNLQL